MQGTKVIRVYNEGLKKLDRINSERPQDMSRADTFDYILRVFEESFEESPEKLRNPSGAFRFIDADNLHIVTPSTIADKMRKDALDLALKNSSIAIRKSYPLEESKE